MLRSDLIVLTISRLRSLYNEFLEVFVALLVVFLDEKIEWKNIRNRFGKSFDLLIKKIS